MLPVFKAADAVEIKQIAGLTTKLVAHSRIELLFPE